MGNNVTAFPGVGTSQNINDANQTSLPVLAPPAGMAQTGATDAFVETIASLETLRAGWMYLGSEGNIQIFCENVLKRLQANLLMNKNMDNQRPKTPEEWAKLGAALVDNAVVIQALLNSHEKMANIDVFFALIGYIPAQAEGAKVSKEAGSIMVELPWEAKGRTVVSSEDFTGNSLVASGPKQLINCPVEFAADDPLIAGGSKTVDCSSMMGINVITNTMSPDQRYRSIVVNALNDELRPYGLLSLGASEESMTGAVDAIRQLRGKEYSLQEKCEIVARRMIVAEMGRRLRNSLSDAEIEALVNPIIDRPEDIKYVLAQISAGYLKSVGGIREMVQSRMALAQVSRENNPGSKPALNADLSIDELLLANHEELSGKKPAPKDVETCINRFLSRYGFNNGEMDHALVYGRVVAKLEDAKVSPRQLRRAVRTVVQNYFVSLVKPVCPFPHRAHSIASDMTRFPLLARMIQKRLGRKHMTSSYQLKQFVAAFHRQVEKETNTNRLASGHGPSTSNAVAQN